MFESGAMVACLSYNLADQGNRAVRQVANRAGTVDQILIAANAQQRYEVQRRDLPLSCPMPGMYLWNSHPKVYLPIEESGEAKCPYCGAQYVLGGAGDSKEN